MTTFACLRRLRRPVAVLLLVCMMSCFICPTRSHAVAPIVAVALHGLRILGTRGATMLARSGSWARAAGGLTARFGSFRSISGTAAVGFVTEKIFDVGKNLWKYIKSHPGDAADIGGLLVDLVDALTGSDMPHTADAVNKALNPQSVDRASNIGEEESRCGGTYVLIEKRLYGVTCCSLDELYDRDESCTQRMVMVEETHPNCTECQSPAGPRTRYLYRYQKVDDTSTPDMEIPDKLSDQQAERLLNEIEKKLQSHREEMEKELDELLKKNLDDIDWPDFDNDAAQEYLAQKRGQDLQDKIDEVQDELERKRQEREQQCQQQQGDCQNKCCDTSCDESRLANRLDQLRDRLDDLNQQQEDQAVQEYPPPAVPETELKKIDFQPVVDLKGELMTKFPFNMLRLIPSAFEVLTAEPVAPYWDANLGDIGGTHRVDFAVLDGLASFIRLVISWLCYIAAVFCCLKIWSRF